METAINKDYRAQQRQVKHELSYKLIYVGKKNVYKIKKSCNDQQHTISIVQMKRSVMQMNKY